MAAPTNAFLIRRVLFACLALGALWAIGDYLNFARQDRWVKDRFQIASAKVGSIGDWPIGKEYSLLIEDRAISDNDIRQLAELRDGLSGRHAVMVTFKHCQVSDDQLATIGDQAPKWRVTRHEE